MRLKIVGLKKFKEFDDEQDSANLLREIKAVLYKYNCYINPYLALDDTKRN